jgi:hypothetical protein
MLRRLKHLRKLARSWASLNWDMLSRRRWRMRNRRRMDRLARKRFETFLRRCGTRFERAQKHRRSAERFGLLTRLRSGVEIFVVHKIEVPLQVAARLTAKLTRPGLLRKETAAQRIKNRRGNRAGKRPAVSMWKCPRPNLETAVPPKGRFAGTLQPRRKFFSRLRVVEVCS